MEEKKMFCFQCEQTAGCTGCTGNIGSILSGEVIQVIGTELPDSKWEKIKEKIIMIN